VPLGARIVDGDWIVDRVRAVKSDAEIECVRRAAEIVDVAFADLLESVRPGQTELQVAAPPRHGHGGSGRRVRRDPDDGLGGT
jgi:Xaa-Pro aminopeptidase